MDDKLKVVPTPRQIIEDKLLAALDDESKAAMLVTADDLDLLTDALDFAAAGMSGSAHYPDGFRRWRDDLLQLRTAAFGKSNDA